LADRPGAFVKTDYAVPAYLGYPDRPYNVIGYLDATTAPIRVINMVYNFILESAKSADSIEKQPA
jgi:hypothetical protein